MNNATRFIVVGIAVVAAMLTPCSGSEQRDRQIFGGGMAVQLGYASLEDRISGFDGVVWGLGGRLHFYIGKLLRLGSSGAAVQLSYDERAVEGSYVRVGYGGLTAELSWPVAKWRISAGVLAGGAGFTNLHIYAQTDTSVEALFDERSTFLLTPLLTVERSLSESISLMGMLDFLWGPDLGDRKHLGGPKLHIGVLFNK